jgi:hypothetical protein
MEAYYYISGNATSVASLLYLHVKDDLRTAVETVKNTLKF